MKPNIFPGYITIQAWFDVKTNISKFREKHPNFFHFKESQIKNPANILRNENIKISHIDLNVEECGVLYREKISLQTKYLKSKRKPVFVKEKYCRLGEFLESSLETE